MNNMGYNNVNPFYKPGLFATLKTVNWGNFLSNTQKTLNIVNQAIPIVYQVKPIVNNARTMFRVIGAVKSDDKVTNTTKPTNNTSNVNVIKTNQPNFFL